MNMLTLMRMTMHHANAENGENVENAETAENDEHH